eukprot:scaffold83945_cov67-Phaeocystis_antarctica.AAC.5
MFYRRGARVWLVDLSTRAMGGVSSEVEYTSHQTCSSCGPSMWGGAYGTTCAHLRVASAGDTRVQRCVWLLTASGVGEHPAAIGAVVDAIMPHRCQIMRLAQVDDGELVRLLVGSREVMIVTIKRGIG